MDYLKLDGCYADPKKMDTGYPMVTKALNNTDRPIVFSCSWPAYQVAAKITVRRMLLPLSLLTKSLLPHSNLYTRVPYISKRTSSAASSHRIPNQYYMYSVFQKHNTEILFCHNKLWSVSQTIFTLFQQSLT